MTQKEFLQPHFYGARFEEGGIPLEVLGDLVALKNMIIDVAKSKFMKEHPRHKRIPQKDYRVEG